MPTREHSWKFRIKVDGAPLPDEVDRALVSAFVDDSRTLPDLFQLSFRDPARTVIEKGRFRIGSKVTISVSSSSSTAGDKLMVGEVTALEAEFDSAGTMTVVRGYDPSHRLFRGRVTETYANATYSDVAGKVARRVGLQVGQVDSASTVHDQVSQGNQSDWEFLKELAAEIGYEMGCFEGRFEFRKPPQSAQGPPKGTLISDGPLELTLGSNLFRLRATVSAAEQVQQVEVRGWDPKQKKEVVATASARASSADVSVKPADLAATFDGEDYVSVGTPYTTQSQVEAAAKAVAEQIGCAFAELEGVARGNPKLRAGTAVSLGLVGEPFDGRYVLTTTRHLYDPDDGYTVWFTVSGSQDRTLLGLVSPATNGSNGSHGSSPFGSVVSAVVTDVDDPDDLGRVKVKFPWLSGKYASDWARTVQAGAGKQRGSVVLPEVNDEVLVAFDRGDVDRPIVLGGLYNGVDKPMLGDGLIDGATGAVKRRGFVSKEGHKLVFLDDQSKSGVLLATAKNGMRIALNDTETTIKVTSKGKVEIEAGSDVTITAKGSLTLKAGTGIKLDGGPQVEVKGSIVKIN
jgi:phage protein D